MITPIIIIACCLVIPLALLGIPFIYSKRTKKFYKISNRFEGRAPKLCKRNSIWAIMKEMNWSEEVATKNLFTDIENMLNYYEKDGNDSFARTGTYMMNNYIGIVWKNWCLQYGKNVFY